MNDPAEVGQRERAPKMCEAAIGVEGHRAFACHQGAGGHRGPRISSRELRSARGKALLELVQPVENDHNIGWTAAITGIALLPDVSTGTAIK